MSDRPGRRFECFAMVEAGGVEPPSEDSLLRATTCVSGLFVYLVSDTVQRNLLTAGSFRDIFSL